MAVLIAPSRFNQRAIRGDEFVPIGAVEQLAQCPYRQGLRFAAETYFGTVDEWLTASGPP
jgi:hypothetical protein